MSIGIFDSGLGGLTVAKAIQQEVPHIPISYFGDTARVPYGTKSAESVNRYSVEIANYLCLVRKTEFLVAACNTVSATAIPHIRKQLPNIKIYDVISSAVGLLEKIAPKNARIGVIGTTATIRSDAYKKRLLAVRPDLIIENQACPLLVPLAEEGWINNEVAVKSLEIYLTSFIRQPPDFLILGCTHYPLFKSTISEMIPPSKTQLIDSADTIAKELRSEFESPINLSSPSNQLDVIVSDIPQRFEWLMHHFLGMKARSIAQHPF